MKNNSLRLELIEKMSTLVSAGLGFVAGLAWNDAIQSLVKTFVPEQSALAAKFIYAILVTAAIVIITVKLSHAADKLKEKLAK
jgi:hypothetical protein